MWNSSRITSLAAFLFGLSLLVWLLYDATRVTETLGLGAVMSEGMVATLGLLTSAAAFIGSVVLWRKAHRQTAGDHVAGR